MHLGVTEKGKKKRFPQIDAYVLIFFILIACAVATYFVPAGEFDRVKNGDVSVTVPGSYHIVESNPTTFKELFTAIQEGMVKGAPLIFLIMFTSGALAVLEKTGAIDAFLRKVVISSKDRLLLLIIPVCFVFSALGTTGIIVNSVIAFIPLGIVIARGLKLDAIFGVALIYLGTYAGWNVPVMAPQTLGLSQRIAELPLLSGFGFRVVIYLVFLAVTIAYIYWYAKKIQRDVSKSALGSELFPNSLGENQIDLVNTDVRITLQQKFVLLFSGLSLVAFIICTLVLKWSENEMAALFIFIAIGSGLIARMSANEIAKTFLQGCQKLVYGALIVGMARAVIIILEDGMLLDTIVNGLATVLAPLSPLTGAVGMYLGSAAIHFLISSGSGESAMLMPILVPLADLLQITRQVAVQAVMFGEGLVNCINPTSGVLMAILATSGIPYGKWIRFILPLIGIWFVIGAVFLIIGVSINWGPF
ncbi:YfcC family protein [Brevibacillus choshinensis]|uniref:YfcC family protein n=1 Tax=Brevibacillus choshinensis TaxID=54911 RepID=UPI002E23FB34|nr:Na+/H+ antiporter NhaC family protein [Brevibacillus choshinensis]MED4782031.1 Na+/H+ antiporter NhaC family protein [Brevibacillus choshinensis]